MFKRRLLICGTLTTILLAATAGTLTHQALADPPADKGGGNGGGGGGGNDGGGETALYGVTDLGGFAGGKDVQSWAFGINDPDASGLVRERCIRDVLGRVVA